MLKMRYGSFVWPNNPRTYTLSCKRQTAVHKIPMGGFVVQDLGRNAAVLCGEGEFFGKDAYAAFQELLTVFEAGGARLLVHPLWQTAGAYFTELALTQEPRDEYVAYRFEFCEAPDGGLTQTGRAATQSAGKKSCELAAGQTLWALCESLGMSMTALLQLNLQIARIGAVAPGTQVRVQ